MKITHDQGCRFPPSGVSAALTLLPAVRHRGREVRSLGSESFRGGHVNPIPVFWSGESSWPRSPVSPWVGQSWTQAVLDTHSHVSRDRDGNKERQSHQVRRKQRVWDRHARGRSRRAGPDRRRDQQGRRVTRPPTILPPSAPGKRTIQPSTGNRFPSRQEHLLCASFACSLRFMPIWEATSCQDQPQACPSLQQLHGWSRMNAAEWSQV